MTGLLVAVAVVVGLAIGSFLNVVVWRVPRGESVVHPPSACPRCGHAIRARDNVPVRLVARCCAAGAATAATRSRRGTRSSRRAPAVAVRPRRLVRRARRGSLPALLLPGRDRRRPRAHRHRHAPAARTRSCCPSYPVALVLLALRQLEPAGESDWAALAARRRSAAPRCSSSTSSLLVVYPRGMGFGDVKLAGVLGLYLGWFGWGALVVGWFAAFLLGGLFSVGLLLAGRAGRKSGIPFGPWMLARRRRRHRRRRAALGRRTSARSELRSSTAAPIGPNVLKSAAATPDRTKELIRPSEGPSWPRHVSSGSTSARRRVRAAELEFGSGGPAGQERRPRSCASARSRCRSAPCATARSRSPRPSRSALRQLWAQAKFESKDVVIGVGNQRVDRPRARPAVDAAGAAARRRCRSRCSELLPMSTDDALLDYFPTGESDGPQGRTVHGMLVAAQRDTVTANVLAVEGAGLRPADGRPQRVRAASARSPAASSRSRTAAFVDIGASITTVVIAAQGVAPPGALAADRAARTSPTPSPARWASPPPRPRPSSARSASATPSVPSARTPPRRSARSCRALVESVRNTFVYYSSNNPGAGHRRRACSPAAARTCPGSGQYLSSASRLPVTLGDPLAGLRSAKTVQRDVAERPRVASSPSPSDWPTELPHDHADSNARGPRSSAGTAPERGRCPQVNLLPPEVRAARGPARHQALAARSASS